MKDHMAQALAVVGMIAVLLGGIEWRLRPIHEGVADLRDDVHDIQRRVSHLEVQVETVLDRLPPAGGRIPRPATVRPAAWYQAEVDRMRSEYEEALAEQRGLRRAEDHPPPCEVR